MTGRRVGALCLGLLPFSALADLACTFEMECIEGEACNETSYEVSVTSSEDGGLLSDISGDVAVLPLGDEVEAWADATASEARLLSVGADGAARYSIHLPDFSITYVGTCTKE